MRSRPSWECSKVLERFCFTLWSSHPWVCLDNATEVTPAEVWRLHSTICRLKTASLS